MFDRFTDRARKVMGLARLESQRFDHDYVGTEHVLLGILEEGSGVAADVMKNLDLDFERLRADLERRLVPGKDPVTTGQLPFTAQGKRALELALEEANDLGHNYIGTEHLLLGLARQQKGIAAEVLRHARVVLHDVREEVVELLGSEVPDEEIGPGELEQLQIENAALRKRVEELEARVRKLETGADKGSA